MMEVTTAPTGTQAIDRAARLLTLVLEGDGTLTVGALSEAANLPKSTTSRLVGALERHGLVRRDAGDGSLRPGPAIDSYARRAKLDDNLPELAHDLLEGLAASSGETVNIVVSTPRGVEQICQVEGAYLLGSTNWIGRVTPFHAAAIGKCFLAFGTVPLGTGPLEALTPKTLTVRADLVRDLERTRQRGWGLSVDEIELGLTAIGAPIRGADGRIIAGISIAGPSIRLSPDRYDQLGAMLVRAADEITERLGHRHLEEGAA